MKILLVGPGDSGKTSLLRKIVTGVQVTTEEDYRSFKLEGFYHKFHSPSSSGEHQVFTIIDNLPDEIQPEIERIVVMIRLTNDIEKSCEKFRSLMKSLYEKDYSSRIAINVIGNYDDSSNRGLKLQAFDEVMNEYGLESNLFINVEEDLNLPQMKDVVRLFFLQ